MQQIGKIGNFKFTADVSTEVDQDNNLDNNENENTKNKGGKSDQLDLGAKLMPREFLKRIPGITSHNISTVEKNVRNMVELARMDEAKLGEVIGIKSAK